MRGRTMIAGMLLCFCLNELRGQVATLRARVEVEGGAKMARASRPATVIWLTPMNGAAGETASALPPTTSLRLAQRNKSFEPHILVVQAGSAVEFPNRDPFFHNVFSLFEGKRFDLGLYEAGSSRMVHFDRPGISYIFCNIHPEMSAVVITLATPFYAVSNADGALSVLNVPYGRYLLHVWSEGTGPETAPAPGREITITESMTSLGAIRVSTVNGQRLSHKNKYGRDYDPVSPDNPVYHQQP